MDNVHTIQTKLNLNSLDYFIHHKESMMHVANLCYFGIAIFASVSRATNTTHTNHIAKSNQLASADLFADIQEANPLPLDVIDEESLSKTPDHDASDVISTKNSEETVESLETSTDPLLCNDSLEIDSNADELINDNHLKPIMITITKPVEKRALYEKRIATIQHLFKANERLTKALLNEEAEQSHTNIETLSTSNLDNNDEGYSEISNDLPSTSSTDDQIEAQQTESAENTDEPESEPKLNLEDQQEVESPTSKVSRLMTSSANGIQVLGIFSQIFGLSLILAIFV